MRFFSLDSPFYKYGTIVFDMLALTFFWFFTILLSLGIFAPHANAALFKSIYHCIIEEEGYMTKTYFGTIKAKLVKGLALSGIGILAFGISIFNLATVWYEIVNITLLLPLYVFIFIEVTMTMLYAYALLAETDMTVKQLMKYGFLLSNKHLVVTLLSLITIVAMYAAFYFTGNPMVIFIVVGPGFWVLCQLIYKRVFSKYYLDKLV